MCTTDRAADAVLVERSAFAMGREDATHELQRTGRRLVSQWIAEDRARDLSSSEYAYYQGMRAALADWNAR